MTPAERRLLEGVSRRAEHVKKFADFALAGNGTYLPSVMAMAAGSLTRTLFVLCGETLREDFLSWLLYTLQETHGICLCGADLIIPDEGLCATCEAQFASEDRELDALEQMERPISGEPS